MRIIFSIIASFLAVLTTMAQYSDTLSLQGAQGNLFAILQAPEKPSVSKKYPLVIVCHGFSSNCETPLIAGIASDVVSEGMAVLRFDFNGHGKSEGLFQDMTVPNEIEDLKKVIYWAQKQPWVKSVSLVGHSQGGVVVSMVSGELGEKTIKSEVLMAPAAVLRDDALRGNTMGAIYDPWNFTGDYIELPFGHIRLGREYIKTAVTLPIYETASNYRGPALIVHGSYDRIVPYTYAERYHDKLSKSTLKIIPGDDHGFSITAPETGRFVADWLHSVLK